MISPWRLCVRDRIRLIDPLHLHCALFFRPVQFLSKKELVVDACRGGMKSLTDFPLPLLP